MNIDLNKIRESLIINESFNYPKEYFNNTEIRDLPRVEFNGRIYSNYENELVLEGKCDGVMILPDSLTLEDIELPFSFEINTIIDENTPEIKEYYEKMKNTLDIMGVLWQNIVLEVPMRITNSKIEDITNCGDGWELVNEKKKEIDPRLAKLSLLLDEDTGKE